MEQLPGKFAGLPLLAWIPLLPFIGALLNLTIGRRLSRQTVHTIAIASVAAACGLSLFLVFSKQGLFHEINGVPIWKAGGFTQNVYTWIEVGSLKLDLSFTLDTLSAVMILIVTFIGTLIHIYSTGYMAHDPRYAAFFGYLNLFMGAMLTLVLGSNLPVMFIGWEGVGLCSFLLIGFWYEREDYASAGRKAFVVNRIGDFCFLLGMFLLFWAGKSLDFKALSNMSQVGPAYVEPFWSGERLSAAAGIFLFIGACGKSAQLPLFVWLPDAMAGPTPVSALIHAATMVTAGVYMVCRLSFLYASSTTALGVVCTVGLLTALAAAFMAFAQTDLKKVLAYSTVSQLGFMFVAAGTGNWVAAIFHLGTHAFFKACLFLGAGSVMHGMEHGGSTTPGDITTMGGLRKHMPITRLTFMISCLAIAGIVPFAGFFSKDEILGGAYTVHPPGWPDWYGKVLWVGLLIAALGTAFYMWRLYFMVFGGEERSEEAKKAHESPLAMTVPLVVLAIGAVCAGFIGLPHFTGAWAHKMPSFTHALATWLEPSVAPAWYNPNGNISPIAGHTTDTTTFVLMGLALMIGLVGIGLAWMFYGKGPSKTLGTIYAEDAPMRPVYEASRAKLWFDEAYDVAIVRPFKLVARGLFEIADRFVIDTIVVNGSAFVVGLLGRISRWVQNGQVQRYLAGLVVGAALVFFIADFRTKPTFEYNFDDHTGMVKLEAKPGQGILTSNAKLGWDLDNDGNPDPGRTEPVLELRAGDIPSSTVTLFIEDPISRKTEKVTRTLDLGSSEETK
jgi:NADH-quinone oxidoreductase subunit L